MVSPMASTCDPYATKCTKAEPKILQVKRGQKWRNAPGLGRKRRNRVRFGCWRGWERLRAGANRWESLAIGQKDLSRLPARVLFPGGERPAPTEAGAETGSQQSATGARSPHDTHCAGRSHASLPSPYRALTKKSEYGKHSYLPLYFWQGQKDLVSPAGSVGSQQSATGARSPLGTRFWSGCGKAHQGARESRCWPVLADNFPKSGAGLVLRDNSVSRNGKKWAENC